jgi:hypothetical protein
VKVPSTCVQYESKGRETQVILTLRSSGVTREKTISSSKGTNTKERVRNCAGIFCCYATDLTTVAQIDGFISGVHKFSKQPRNQPKFWTSEG